MIEIDTDLLKKRVRQSGLTIAELADQACISENTIHNIKSGRHSPSYEAIRGLSRALKLPQEDFMYIFYSDLIVLEDELEPVKMEMI